MFDFHIHLLFKHFFHDPKKPLTINQDLKVEGFAQILDEIFGGFFDSQSSPSQVVNSPLRLGVISIIAMEHAFANKILNVKGLDLQFILPLDKQALLETKEGKRTYYDEFKRQEKFYLDHQAALSAAPFHFDFIRRSDDRWKNKSRTDIETMLLESNRKSFVFSIEGGHNLSTALIRGAKGTQSHNPERQLAEIQANNDIDYLSMNLCHLSDIPEQRLGGFAQGLNRTAQIAFQSDDFMPKVDLGISQLGKKVVRQALTHKTKPILIDIKHMSVYTRYHFYRFREQLIIDHPSVDRLPIISSHSGFTFTSLKSYLEKKEYQSEIKGEDGSLTCKIIPQNRLVGRTNDRRNAKIYANPWTIGLFDEEILEIMDSNGLIGISMDQRVLGTSKIWMDGINRPKFYEEEYVSEPEWKKLFRDGQLPSATEGLFERILGAPTRAERHIMLFCNHLIYAARLGYENKVWTGDRSPWDHLCIGSDFDGLINPLNGYKDVTAMAHLESDLHKYLPIADKFLAGEGRDALKYDEAGRPDVAFLKEVIDKVVYKNGVRFIAGFLSNWE